MTSLSHRNEAEECPEWAIPSRRWVWRIAIAFCAAIWAVVLLWLFGGFTSSG
ncbi:MAG: hypothetical protein AAGG09_03115 [Pseudomonadota bacterium]